MGKKKLEKMTNEILQQKMTYDFSRDAEWYKRTLEKIEKVKEELNKNFYNETRKAQKMDFISKLRLKIKDYSDAVKFQARYKKIRFIERRKIERKMNKIKKEIEGETDKEKLKELNEKKEMIVKDLNYVKFYPTTYKYYSLFPINDKDKKEMVEKREMMRKKIEFYVNRRHNKEKEYYDTDSDVEMKDEEIKTETKKSNKKKEIIEENDNKEIKEEEEAIEKPKEKSKHKSKKKEIEEDDKPMEEVEEDKEEEIVSPKKQHKEKSNKGTKDINKKEETNNGDYEITKHKKKKPFKDDFFIVDN